MGFLDFLSYEKVNQSIGQPMKEKVSYEGIQSPSYSYLGRPNEGQETKAQATFLMDESITIITDSNDKRTKAQSAWSSLCKKTCLTGTFSILTGLTTGGLIAYNKLKSPFIAAAIVLNFLGLALFARGAAAYGKSQEWESPLKKISDNRQKCDPEKGGFKALRQEPSLQQYVHCLELKQIWYKANAIQQEEFIKVKQSGDPKKQEAFINEFFKEYNPLYKKSVEFAFPLNDEDIANPQHTGASKPRAQVNGVSEQFGKYLTQFNEIDNRFKDLRQEVENKKQKLLDINQKNWDNDLAIKGFKLTKNLFIEKYTKKRDELLKPILEKKDKELKSLEESKKLQIKQIEEDSQTYIGDKQDFINTKTKQLDEKIKTQTKEINEKYQPQIDKYNKKCEEKVNQAKFIYNMAVLPFDNHYKNEALKIENEAKEKFEELKKNQTAQLLPMLNCIDFLYTAFNKEEIVESNLYPTFSDYSAFQLSYEPSAPSSMNPPSYNPEWSSQFSQQDYIEFVQHQNSVQIK